MLKGARGLILVVAVAALASGCLNRSPDRAPDDAEFAATIRWTQYGIPHVTADDWAGLGYGYGYAFAKDGACTLMEEIVTVNGERSRYFGADGMAQLGAQVPAFGTLTNLKSDLYFALLKQNPDLVRSSVTNARPELQDLVRGYAAGFNRFLRDAPADQIPVPCRGAEWVRPITYDDLVLRINKVQLFASGYQFAPAMYDARPPSPNNPVQRGPRLDVHDLRPENLGLGSNAYAFGRAATHDGQGMLLGNPHFPWKGPERFHEVHLTIPGTLDVMGMALVGTPLVEIGFTRDFAWSHTVSTAWRFGLYELTLASGDPTSYMYEGSPRKMTTRTAIIQVLEPDGRLRNQTHSFYYSHYGPIVVADLVANVGSNEGLAWTQSHAYAVRDANADNDRILEQWSRMITATDFDAFHQSLSDVLGIPWVNTIAASSDGRALYADLTVVPNVSNAQLQTCNTALGRATTSLANLPILDGSKASCAWRVDPRAPQAGIIPATELPQALRDDFVINANDSHWLPNPAQPLTGYSTMLGPEATERSLRTRMGFVQIEERLGGKADCAIDPQAACDKYTLARLQDQLFADRMLGAELARDAIVSQACANPMVATPDGRLVDIGPACKSLAAWDLRANLDSRGVGLFEQFWLDQLGGRRPQIQWATPFDAKDPVHTPRGFLGANPAVRQSLATATTRLTDAKIGLDAPTGEVRYAIRNEERIPLHGAHGAIGAPNMMQYPFVAGKGWTDTIHGTSYVQTVTFDGTRPIADALLTYSQSTDPASPHYADQTRLYSEKRWHRLPFLEAEIEADPALTRRAIWE